MGLATYRSCTFAEKRAVLRTFWSRQPDESDRIVQAAREYGPYAMVMVAVITVELLVISGSLLAAGSGWAWPGAVATLGAALGAWWARGCQRALSLSAT
ncbi:MAG TPA: hypothetical protein VMV53_05975 [Acidimicrobiales bacterium]|nr:hypothetical protein [Acidimicrobiales bacterium]